MNAVLEGSVRRSGNRARINVQLINAANDAQIWAENYDRELTDAYALQSDLAFAYRLCVESETDARRNGTACSVVLRKTARRICFTCKRNDRLRQLSEANWLIWRKPSSFTKKRSSSIPSFALAYAQLSQVETTLEQLRMTPRLRGAKRRERAAQKALQLQPDLPEAHMALGR